jgi:hypothetical protein
MKASLSLTLILALMTSALPVTAQEQTEAPQSFDLRNPEAATVAAAIAAGLFGLQADSAAFAQSALHVELGPVVRVDRVDFGPFDAPIGSNASGDVKVAGVLATVRIGRHFGVDAEFTQAWGRIEVEANYPYQHVLLSPGFGWSSALAAGGAIAPRVSLFGRAGLAARSYSETVFPVLFGSVQVGPPGYVQEHSHGGILLGFDVAVAVTDHLSVAPEFRFVHGLILSNYRELGVGVRGAWRFR